MKRFGHWLAISLISGLTTTCLAQAVVRPFGLIRPTEEQYLNYPIVGLAPTGVLPPRFLLEAYFPPAGHQGLTQGSCTAWSTTFALRTAIEAKSSAAWQPLGAANRQFSPSFIFNLAKFRLGGPLNCATGIYFETALDLLKVTGTTTIAEFPYDPGSCSLQANSTQLSHASSFKIASWYRADLTLLALKSQLASGHPVLVGVDVYGSFYNAQQGQTIAGNTGPPMGYHAIVLIGYDDTRGDRGAFRIQNSWGQNWGDQGRAWIDYETLMGATREAYIVVPLMTDDSFFVPNPNLISRFGIVNDASQPQTFGILNSRTKSAVLSVEGVLPPPLEAAKLGVVAASFPTLAQARALARSLTEGPSGLTAKVLRRTENGVAVYSVLVAAGLDSAEATLVAERAKRLGFAATKAVRLP